ncbi:MAG: radical SAM protein [Candidatus Eisenbacteria bacterium]|nr:radical SAM protein [Candidatus Eisenbacteria bacterium]
MERFPAQPLHHLDVLWIQVAGTLCNLSCTHCFVTCGPGERRHPMMSRGEVRARVAEALGMGVREFYFTGGEPFLHPDLIEILEDTLASAPATVLTNGTLLTASRIESLRRLSDESRSSLEIRVSLDGLDAAAHDAFRGAGAFARTIEGLRDLEASGLLPIVTVTHTGDDDPLVFRERCLHALGALGLSRPRIKTLPMFRLGRETTRTRGYAEIESLRDLPESAFDPHRLQCGSCRAVSAKGVHVCPLLVDEPGGRMGERLDQTLTPFKLSHGACFTCYVTGMTCGNG